MGNMGKGVLVVAAHPDDDVLGCGGTIARLVNEGSDVSVIFIADGVASRETGVKIESCGSDQSLLDRRNAAKLAASVLGISSVRFCDFPDNRLDSVPLLNVVQKIEQIIGEFQPSTVFTHHAGDLNIDHRIVHQAVMTACRPQVGHPVRSILCFEVPSSTEWRTPGIGSAFEPNWFVDISTTLDTKLSALDAYAEEMRDWPHPRSRKGVEALARWRGATVGCDAAEAFMLARCLQ